MPRARRHDPDRRDRIADAAVEVIAEHGVAGLSHRRVAAAADVPLGSMTYHFEGTQDLLRVAFQRHVERSVPRWTAHFDAVADRDGFLDAVTDLVHGAFGDERAWVVNYELYLAAQRDPALREVTEGWMRASREVLRRHVDRWAAHGLDALVEGLQIHQGLSTDAPARETTREIVATFLSGVEVTA